MNEKLGEQVRKVQDTGKEIQYQIPNEVSSRFKDFFQGLDKDLEKLGL